MVLVVLLPLCVVARWFLLFVHWNTQRSRYQVSGGLESMCGADIRWLGDAWRSSILHAVLQFDSRLCAPEAQALLSTRVLPAYPRLTRLPVALPLTAGAGYCWLPDAGFDIKRHVFDVTADQTSNIQDYLGGLMNVELSHDKSPWELHCIQGDSDNSTTAILRIHQSLADGTTLVQLLAHALADKKTVVHTSSQYSTNTMYYRYLRACLVGPITLICWLLCSPPSHPTKLPSSAWTKQYSVSCSNTIAMDKVVHIKQVTRSSVNSVLLSAMSGALRVLLQSSGIHQPGDMKAILPIDLYPQGCRSDSRLCSKKSSILISLPVSVEGGVPRLWKTRQIIKNVRKSSDPFVIYLASSALMSLVPSQYVRNMLTKATEDTATLKFSWLKGPDSVIEVGGRQLKAIYSLLPVQPGLGISVSMFIYANTLFVTSTTDKALGDVGGFLLHHLNTQIESLYELLKFRRNPSTKLDAITFYCFPDISNAPVKEVSCRMREVQDEIEELMDPEIELTREESERLHYLKSEFAYLLKELRKRRSVSKHSLFSKSLPSDIDLEEEEALCRPHRPRTMSCSFVSAHSRRPSLSLLSKKRPTSLCMEAMQPPTSLGGSRVNDLPRTHRTSNSDLKIGPGKTSNVPNARYSGSPLSGEYVQLNCYSHSNSNADPKTVPTSDTGLKQSCTSFNLQCKRSHFKKQKSDNNIIFYNNNGTGCVSGTSGPYKHNGSYSSMNKISTSPHCISPVCNQYGVAYHEDCQLTQVTFTSST
uniref:Diacyglycerol O-acyltransferase Mb3154c n=1 Tax=Cacopsylla melanoneura TaxID=428564 RepID=A0A8D9EV76_9HEMI